jgi:hypothetical protein
VLLPAPVLPEASPLSPLRRRDPAMVLIEDGVGALDGRPRTVVDRRDRACHRQIDRCLIAPHPCDDLALTSDERT